MAPYVGFRRIKSGIFKKKKLPLLRNDLIALLQVGSSMVVFLGMKSIQRTFANDFILPIAIAIVTKIIFKNILS